MRKLGKAGKTWPKMQRGCDVLQTKICIAVCYGLPPNPHLIRQLIPIAL